MRRHLMLALTLASLAHLRYAAAVDERATITAGEPGYLLFVIPESINVTSSTYRGCRFYKDDVLLCVIKRGANTEMCQKEEICKNMKFHVNGSHATVDIPRASVNDSGSYSVEFVFSAHDSNFKQVHRLNVIEGPIGNPTINPQASSETVTVTDGPIENPTINPQASSETATVTDEPFSPKRSSASASDISYHKLATLVMVFLCCLPMF